MSSTVIMETTAEHHPGFPQLLWRAVNEVLGSPTRPGYVIYQDSDEYRADVQIIPCPWGTTNPYWIHGKSMPTLDQAIQIVAWECLSRLRYTEPPMGASRAFRFYPSRPRAGAQFVATDLQGETDPAVHGLLGYAAAMTKFSISVVEELNKTKGRLARARMRQTARHAHSHPGRQAPREGPLIPDPGPSQPIPEEGEDIDTTLRLSLAPPGASGR